MPRKNDTKLPQAKIDKFLKRHYGGESVAALAKEYKVSRATAYVWIARHREKMLDQGWRSALPGTAPAIDGMSLKEQNALLKAEVRKLRERLLNALIKYGEI